MRRKVLISTDQAMQAISPSTRPLDEVSPSARFLSFLHLTWLSRYSPGDYPDDMREQVMQSQSCLVVLIVAFLLEILAETHALQIKAIVGAVEPVRLYQQLVEALAVRNQRKFEYLSPSAVEECFGISWVNFEPNEIVSSLVGLRAERAYGGFVGRAAGYSLTPEETINKGNSLPPVPADGN